MAKNELVALALIYHEPRHAYALNATIQDMNLEHWARISQASLYTCLNRLNRQGCVEVCTEKVGNMPERKIFSITPQGKQRYLQEVREALLKGTMGDNPFYLGVGFGFGLPPQEAIGLVKERIERLQWVLEHLQQAHQQCTAFACPTAMLITRAGSRHVQVELDAAREYLQLLEQSPCPEQGSDITAALCGKSTVNTSILNSSITKGTSES
jgi:DNA-binding PadR family transcriptional regulator